MTLICQSQLPEDMRLERALPGIQPLDMRDWLRMDDVYAAQMGERIDLMASNGSSVRAVCPGSDEAVAEAFNLIIQHIQSFDGFGLHGNEMRCPDGRQVDLTGDPLFVLGHLIQQDICIMQKPEGEEEHILSAALLCFPAHWTLAEKIGKPMGRIHAPVEVYDEYLRRRVQRLFDGVQVGRPLWRFNRAYAGPSLYQPRSESDYAEADPKMSEDFLRSERQCMVRLPRTGAVIFSIHTYVIDMREQTSS